MIPSMLDGVIPVPRCESGVKNPCYFPSGKWESGGFCKGVWKLSLSSGV